eukprot:6467699-Amphidinium_carterae.2
MTTRANQRLEQLEASIREVEVLIARERDQYYEELLQTVTNGTTPAVTSTPLTATPLLPSVPTAPVGTSQAPSAQASQPAASPVHHPAPAPQPVGANPLIGVRPCQPQEIQEIL